MMAITFQLEHVGHMLALHLHYFIFPAGLFLQGGSAGHLWVYDHALFQLQCTETPCWHGAKRDYASLWEEPRHRIRITLLGEHVFFLDQCQVIWDIFFVGSIKKPMVGLRLGRIDVALPKWYWLYQCDDRPCARIRRCCIDWTVIFPLQWMGRFFPFRPILYGWLLLSLEGF